LLDDDRLHVESLEIVSIDELSGDPTTLGVHRSAGSPPDLPVPCIGVETAMITR